MKNVSYYLFSHNALFSFIRGVIDLVEKTNTEELGLKVFLKNTKTQFSRFDNALKRDYVNPFTQTMISTDRSRDDRFIGFKAYVAACKYRKNKNWLIAAEELERLIDRYGGELYKMSYAEESAALDNLIADLQTAPFKKAIRTIQANDWQDEMIEEHEAFKALNQKRNETEDPNTETIGDTRKPAIRALRSLLSMIRLQEEAMDNPALSDLVAQLNKHISKSMASARLSHSLNDKEEPSEEILP